MWIARAKNALVTSAWLVGRPQSPADAKPCIWRQAHQKPSPKRGLHWLHQYVGTHSAVPPFRCIETAPCVDRVIIIAAIHAYGTIQVHMLYLYWGSWRGLNAGANHVASGLLAQVTGGRSHVPATSLRRSWKISDASTCTQTRKKSDSVSHHKSLSTR